MDFGLENLKQISEYRRARRVGEFTCSMWKGVKGEDFRGRSDWPLCTPLSGGERIAAFRRLGKVEDKGGDGWNSAGSGSILRRRTNARDVLGWTRPWARVFKDKVVLEAGCGKGRTRDGRAWGTQKIIGSTQRLGRISFKATRGLDNAQVQRNFHLPFEGLRLASRRRLITADPRAVSSR